MVVGDSSGERVVAAIVAVVMAMGQACDQKKPPRFLCSYKSHHLNECQRIILILTH